MVTLYAVDGCPYCETIHDALDDNDIAYETIWTAPLHSDRGEVKRVSCQRRVPVILHEAPVFTMPEREKIASFSERRIA